MPRTNDQFCTIAETYTSSTLDLLANQSANTQTIVVPGGYGHFPRTNAMAALFQMMRVAYVKYTYEPLYNVFQGTATAAVGTSMPDFYTLMDRQGAYSNTSVPTSLEGLIAGGAKPRKFTKNITVQYKPNTLGLTSTVPASYNTATVPGTFATDIQFDRWFQTSCLNATTLTTPVIYYYGHLVYISQENSVANSAPIARVTQTIVTQFRLPFYPTS